MVGVLARALRESDATDRAIAKLDTQLGKLAEETAERWRLLAELRRTGRRPNLPVFVVSRTVLAENLTGAGCFAIVHRPGFPMPVDLLHGLDVFLDFGLCGFAASVKRLMDERGVQPRSLRAWCDCAGEYVVTCGDCDEGDEPWAG